MGRLPLAPRRGARRTGTPSRNCGLISRYDDVVAVEKDGARYSSFSGSRPHI